MSSKTSLASERDFPSCKKEGYGIARSLGWILLACVYNDSKDRGAFGAVDHLPQLQSSEISDSSSLAGR